MALIDERHHVGDIYDEDDYAYQRPTKIYGYQHEDVEEFIRRLKEEIGNPDLLTKNYKSMKYHDIIDKLSGFEGELC